MATTALLTLVGAFYVFAGVFATRVGLTSRLLDRAISAITLEKTNAAEVTRDRLNLAISAITFAGGVLLMARFDAAVVAFLACAALQAAYLFMISPRWLDLVDPPNPAGRRQSTNAFVIYLAATALVAWAWSTNKLTPVTEASWPILAAVAVAFAAFGIYMARAVAVSRDRSHT